MPKRTFTCLLIATGYGIAGGLLSLIIASLMQTGHYTHSGEDFFSEESVAILLGCAISLIAPFGFAVAFLLPLAAIEKTVFEKRGAYGLIRRFMPLPVLPAAGLFILILSVFQNPNERGIALSALVTLFGVCVFSLTGFIKHIKK